MVGDGALTFGLLGPVAAWSGGRAVPLGGIRQRVALALLLLEVGRPVPFDRLVDAVWGEAPPPTARKALQVHVRGLRLALAAVDGVELVTVNSGYAIRIVPDRIDLHRFRRLASRAGQAAPEPTATMLREALELRRGPAMADLAGHSWVDRAAATIDEEMLAALDRRIDADLAVGRHAELVPELTGLVADQPLRESARCQLMLALYRSGRTAEAVAAYRDARETLVAELGVEPGPELRRLHRAVLNGDPTILPAGQPGSAIVPRQLPADLDDFVGRAAELDHVLARLPAAGRNPAVMAIDGTGGIGKSALAVHAAHRLSDRYPDGQLFIDLHGYSQGIPPVRPVEALGRMLQALGHPAAQIPHEVDDCAALYRSLIAGRRMLVLLDNAAAEDQVQPLLPGTSECLVFVTSRRRLTGLDNAHPLSLDTLRPFDAVRLFVRVTGEERVTDVAPEQLVEAVQLCGRLPLAIRIAAARLRARLAWTVTDLVERLRDQRHRLSELEAGQRSVTATFDLSYQRLTPDQQRMLRLLGVYPGADIGFHAAAALADISLPAARWLLEALVDAHVLESPAPGRYQLHDLLRDYAATVATRDEPEPERRAAVVRLLRLLVGSAWSASATLHPGTHRTARADPGWADGGRTFDSATAVLAWWQLEHANLLAAATRAAAIPALARAICQLAHALFDIFEATGSWRDCEQINQLAVTVAERMADRSAEALARCDLGNAYSLQGRVHEAARLQEQCMAIWTELDDQAGVALSLIRLGNIHMRLARYPDALKCFRRSLAIARRLRHRGREATNLGNLGIVYRRLTKHREALRYLRQSLAVCEEVGDPLGQARNFNRIGSVYADLERYDEALAHLRKSLDLSRGLGDRYCIAGTLDEIGSVHHAQRRYRDALTCYRESLTTCRELGTQHGLAEVLYHTGLTLEELGRHDEASRHWDEALAICEQLGLPVPGDLACRARPGPYSTPTTKKSG